MPRAQAGAFLLSTVLATACARPELHPTQPSIPANALERPSPSAPAGASPSPNADLQSLVLRVLSGVSKLRELRPKGFVQTQETTREEMRAWLNDQLASDVPPEVMAGNAAFLLALGLVPKDFDYAASIERLMTQQLAGFYDPKTKTMHLLSDLRAEDRKATLDHELVHALQDQHFDLERLTAWHSDATDEQSAVHALAEGDATSAMLQGMLAPGQHAEDLPDEMLSAQAESSLASSPDTEVPNILKHSLLAPYIDGLKLVHWARRRGGWASVDDLWRRMPASSEQMLHPEKWLSDERPEPVAVPIAAPGTLQSVFYHDILGEQSVRILLEEWLTKSEASTAASGWGGDRLAVFRNGEFWSLAWHLVADDRDAATRTRVALQRGLLALAPQANGALTSEQVRREVRLHGGCRERPDLGPITVQGEGFSVVIVVGPYRNKEGHLASAGDCHSAIAWAKAVMKQQSAGTARLGSQTSVGHP